MTCHDVDHATDSVRSVECCALRATNYLDPLHGLRRELGDEQRIGELDAVDVDLRIAGAERAGTANTSVMSEQRCRRCLPHPQSRNDVAQRLAKIPLGVARKLSSVDDIHSYGERSRRRFDRISGHNYPIEHSRPRLTARRSGGRQDDMFTAGRDR